MATDDEYISFLDKANADVHAGVEAITAGETGKVELKAVDEGVDVPQALLYALKDCIYVSDTDEPFLPVALKLEGKTLSLPDKDNFAQLVDHQQSEDREIKVMDVDKWDPLRQYTKLVDAVRQTASGSSVQVYQVPHGGPRFEYWVVGLRDGKLVGAKTLAIET